LLAAFVLFGALIGIAYARTTIPSPSTLAAEQTTTIYYSDGKTKLATIGDINRTDVPLSQVPPWVQHAVLAAEDRHFYSEPGISPTGIIRALLVDLKGGDISQGGSTITQQYAKNAYLSPRRSLTRKLKEIFIATKLGQSKSKKTILEDYLNTVYFGRGAYGIQTASIAYFGHGVAQLTRSEGALLAAVIRGPAIYDPRPATNKPAALQRWQYVVQGMLKQGWLTQQQANRMHFPKTKALKPSGSSACAAKKATCYIRDAVEYELRTQDGLTQSQLDLGGYKIVTTISKPAEDGLVAAEDAILPKNNKGTPESGAAAIQPGDGAIRALYGGANYCSHTKQDPDACIDLSGATGSWARPPGSSFKVFTMLAALKSGDFSLNSTFNGPYTVDVDGTPIHNSSPGESCYGCSMTRALAESINTIFVPLAKQVGPQKVVDAAYAAGIPTSRKLPPFPDISLGPADVSPLDLADAYATVAAQGVHADPYLVQSVTTNNGQRIYRHTSKPTDDVFGKNSKAVTADATYAMEQVLRPGGTAYGRGLSGRPAAGKTGTTDANTNAWFTGFTPQLCLSVWIGNKDRNKTVAAGGVGEVFGGTLPAEIWQSAMNAALANKPVEQFPGPANIGVTRHQGGTPSATPSSASPSHSPKSTPTSVVTITPPPITNSPPPVTHTPTPTSKPTITPTSSPTGGTLGNHGTTSSPSP
jgi:membrane peptidoglycan carboxypeptidase